MKIDTLGLLKYSNKTLMEIAVHQRLGITTINKHVRELKDEKLIDSNLSVLDSGETLLKSKEVTNVIILAAGWGSRMSPASDFTPKPLIKIHGKPMIETTIETLHKAGMKNITVVIGKEHQKFEYLSKIYNVELVINKDWNKRGSIASLEVVKEKLGNTLVLEGDAPVYSQEILLKYINDPVFYGSYFEGPTAEWTFNMRGSNITSIDKGGEDSYIWKGGWYMTNESSEMYRNWLSRNFENPKFRDSDAGFILIDMFKEVNKFIRLYRINDGDMVECDTFEELCQIDPTYLIGKKDD